MTNPLPHNAIPLLDEAGVQRNDQGKRVVINSVGGPSWPDNRWKRAIENVKGTVVWGPCQLWFTAKAKTGKVLNGKPILKEKKFVTNPYWGVKLDGYGREITFSEPEITFL